MYQSVSSSLFSQKPAFFCIPKNATLARYQSINGNVAVITPSGQILAESFYALRHRFTFGEVLYGAGGWVVLLPIEAPTLPTLF